MIIPMHTLLEDAIKRVYGIAAPNVLNRETIEAAFLAAKELRAPIILDVAGVHGVYECADLARFYERRYPEVPVALNLDHGETYEEVISAIHAGFSSVMVDRSECPFEQNVAEVKEIAKIAHVVGISVEAELGHVGMGNEYEQTRDAGLTRPEEAVRYVEETGADCLAVAVGTSHGLYRGTPKLEFDLLDRLAKDVSVPLVLHGGSSTGDDNLQKAIRHGIQKVNLNTDLNEGGLAMVKAACENNFMVNVAPGAGGEMNTQRMNLQKLFAAGAIGWKEVLKHYVELFGGAGRW